MSVKWTYTSVTVTHRGICNRILEAILTWAEELDNTKYVSIISRLWYDLRSPTVLGQEG